MFNYGRTKQKNGVNTRHNFLIDLAEIYFYGKNSETIRRRVENDQKNITDFDLV